LLNWSAATREGEFGSCIFHFAANFKNARAKLINYNLSFFGGSLLAYFAKSGEKFVVLKLQLGLVKSCREYCWTSREKVFFLFARLW
jgi:hypothetical protein